MLTLFAYSRIIKHAIAMQADARPSSPAHYEKTERELMVALHRGVKKLTLRLAEIDDSSSHELDGQMRLLQKWAGSSKV